MAPFPKALEQLVTEFSRLPGVGRRGAERMAFALLTGESEQTVSLVRALERLHGDVGLCERCGFYTDEGRCAICDNPSRQAALLCVVETPLDVIAFERAGGFEGLYHVLGGSLSPLKGVTPDDLAMDALGRRIEENGVTELILATSPSVEGDATALYIARTYGREDLSITRIGRGVPMGGSLDLTDGATLRLALEGRRAFD